VGVGPGLLQAAGVPPQRRPGVPDPQFGAGLLDDVVQVRHLVQHAPRPGENLGAGAGRAHLPGGALQQPGAERGLQRGDGPRNRRLRDAQGHSCFGERSGVDHRDQSTQVTQLHIHTSTV
jgi:hypothetical protein